MGDTTQIDPSCDDSDNSGGAFMMFAIRDALEFAGLLPNRKRLPAREYRLALHKFNFLTSKTEYLNKVIASLEDQWEWMKYLEEYYSLHTLLLCHFTLKLIFLLNRSNVKTN